MYGALNLVLIIKLLLERGGGVAGLAATASVSEAGFDGVLLKAPDYFGGRVKQVQPFKGFCTS